MKAYVYVDGFNLYYGAVKNTPYRWLDLSRLCKFLLPKDEIATIKYFTALVSARPHDPDKPIRQQLFLRALRTLPNLEIIYGSFLTNKVFMPVADQKSPHGKYVEVIKTEEKGSDVNLAAHMINDAHLRRFELAVLVSNDSDLCEPVRLCREMGFPVGMINPHPKTSFELKKYVSFIKKIRKGTLAASQFSVTLEDAIGKFSKPPAW